MRQRIKDQLQRCHLHCQNYSRWCAARIQNLTSIVQLYIADLPTPTVLVKVVSYANDITVYATGLKISELETVLNIYMNNLSNFLTSRELIISAVKSTVTFFTPDLAQAKLHPQTNTNGTLLPLCKTPKILGVTFDTLCIPSAHKGGRQQCQQMQQHHQSADRNIMGPTERDFGNHL